VCAESKRLQCLDVLKGCRKECVQGDILRGEFVNHRKPLDPRKVQGRYGDVFPKGSKLRRGRAVDQDHEGC
jgi:hypothetical protein